MQLCTSILYKAYLSICSPEKRRDRNPLCYPSAHAGSKFKMQMRERKPVSDSNIAFAYREEGDICSTLSVADVLSLMSILIRDTSTRQTQNDHTVCFSIHSSTHFLSFSGHVAKQSVNSTDRRHSAADEYGRRHGATTTISAPFSRGDATDDG